MSISRRAFLATTASVGTGIGCSSLITKASESLTNEGQLHTISEQKWNEDQVLSAIDAWVDIEYSPRRSNNWYSFIFVRIRRDHVRSFIKNHLLNYNKLPRGVHDLGYTDENNMVHKKVRVGNINFYRLPDEIEAILSINS
jgi:hypothetical protein